MKRRLINFALWLASVHTSCAAFWTDVADAINTGDSISDIRKQRENDK